MTQIALVTGASSGIGKALVKTLLKENYEVIGMAKTAEKLHKLVSEINNSHLHIFACDVSDISQVRIVSLELKERNLIPHLFFLNAGITGHKILESTETLDINHHRMLFDVNYFGVLNFVKEWLESCKKNGGATFVVSNSINAILAPPRAAAYCATKAALAKAFDSLRMTHKSNNLKFCTIFCGPVDTPGHIGKLPFTWKSSKMAQYMLKKAKKGKARSHPSWFYSLLAKVLNWLPDKITLRIIKLITKNEISPPVANP